MNYVPKWTMVDGKACYEFSQAKKLVEIDDELDTLLRKELVWQQLTKDLQDGRKQLQLALTAETSAKTTLAQNNADLASRLLTETARADKAEARPGAFPAWAIAGGIGIGAGVIVGILLGVYVAK